MMNFVLKKRRMFIMKNKVLALAAICIAINMGLGQLASSVKLPIFLDSIGTVLAAVLMGPWVGALTGLVTNLIWGLLTSPVAAAFAPVAMVIGITAGFLAKKGMFKSIGGVIISGIVVTIFVTIVATPIRTYLFAGVTGSGADFFVAYLSAVGNNLLESVAVTVIASNLADKVVTCALVWLILKRLPSRIKSQFPDV